jgi:hypothetical protein
MTNRRCEEEQTATAENPKSTTTVKDNKPLLERTSNS